mmetsp:Transcript_5047/g.11123  ORF Transcript_5047/g.11123 Transcript_5047/m.11123 type:complete len:269 (+) Transcript_5047:109-915(+)
MYIGRSELVQVVRQLGHLHLQVLALADGQDHVLHLTSLHGVAWHGIPVIEDALWEGLSTGLLSQSRHEAEGLSDGQVGLHLHQRCAFTLVLLEDAAAPQVHAGVDTAHGILWACDLHQEHWLLKGGLGCHLRSEAAAPCWGHDLASTSVDGIGVQGHIHDVEADTTHVLFAERPLLRGPLEGTVHVLLDFDQVLHGLGLVHHHVGALSLRTPAPDLSCGVLIPLELLPQDLGALLRIRLWAGLAVLNQHGQLFGQRLSNEVDTVVLVG